MTLAPVGNCSGAETCPHLEENGVFYRDWGWGWGGWMGEMGGIDKMKLYGGRLCTRLVVHLARPIGIGKRAQWLVLDNEMLAV